MTKPRQTNNYETLALTWTSLFVAGSFACAEPEIKGTATELTQFLNGAPKMAMVTGEAEIRVPARRAVVTLKVVTENKSLQEALRLNGEQRIKLAEHLKKQGISADRIQASKFSSTPKFGIFSEKARSYRVENMIRVALQEEKEFQAVASAVDQSSEVQFGEVEFEYADREALKQKVLGQACDNANERKKIYEEKFNLNLTPASVGEELIVPQNAANQYGINSKRAYVSASVPAVTSADGETTAGESVSSFGELVYTARVRVEYTAQPK